MVKFIYVKKLLFSIFFIGLTIGIKAQNSDLVWERSTHHEKYELKKMDRRSQPKESQIFNLNRSELKVKLQRVTSKALKNKANQIVSFPNSKGKLERFEIYEVTVLSEKLQQKDPDIK